MTRVASVPADHRIGSHRAFRKPCQQRLRPSCVIPGSVCTSSALTSDMKEHLARWRSQGNSNSVSSLSNSLPEKVRKTIAGQTNMISSKSTSSTSGSLSGAEPSSTECGSDWAGEAGKSQQLLAQTANDVGKVAQPQCKPSVINFSYSGGAGTDDHPEHLVVSARSSAHFVPFLCAAAETWQALEEHVLFVAEPELPEGLSMDPKSGVISGDLSEIVEGSATYKIKMKVTAQGPGGVHLGMVPVACRTIMFRR